MKFVRLGILAWIFAHIVGCAPVSKVILLPQDDGRPSAVEVKTASSSLLLTRPFETASIGQRGEMQLGSTTLAAVAAQYKVLFDMQPPKAIRFTLFFAEGSRLTADSEVQLAEALALAYARQGAEIFVTGHTDTTGSSEVNDALSLQRAQVIRARLIARGFSAGLIEAIGRGERELSVQTADDVEEPFNRRVEVTIR